MECAEELVCDPPAAAVLLLLGDAAGKSPARGQRTLHLLRRLKCSVHHQLDKWVNTALQDRRPAGKPAAVCVHTVRHDVGQLVKHPVRCFLAEPAQVFKEVSGFLTGGPGGGIGAVSIFGKEPLRSVPLCSLFHLSILTSLTTVDSFLEGGLKPNFGLREKFFCFVRSEYIFFQPYTMGS